MIQEDYVSYETAKLLKEKGFDAQSYASIKVFCGSNRYYELNGEWITPEEDTIIPTLQMAMKWLREVYNQIIVPGIRLYDGTSGTINCYIVGIWYIPKNNGGAFCYTSPTPYNGYPSFEEACEAGIRYCLENLI